jgi:hydrogenase maturation protease
MPSAILVVGIGNRLLCDDGVGIELMERLQKRYAGREGVAFIDGGTLGLVLLGYLEGRRAVLFLDAVAGSAPGGTVHELTLADLETMRSNDTVSTAHESGAIQLIATAKLIGVLPETVSVVGIEPESLRTGEEFSEVVTKAIPAALEKAASRLDRLLGELGKEASGTNEQLASDNLR